ncbi:cysteine hydrolase family protein [Vibrio diazotrophicus]|uniref:cysteine hydrolase family protein n=1 Tax=Vibrio diazotrophicus TaxID=685 RepID=UPI00142D989D|nr:cysteine hydrolase family protein [Vibrio diazotrophicus]NIY93777.1 cysteine hydrolase [Vibrio diazotrophicus]
MSNKALLVIDIQNDYFEKGKFPLWNTDRTLSNIKNLTTKANALNVPVFLVQHVSSAPKGMAPFFERGSHGVDIHPEIKQICSSAQVVEKHHADSFYQTNLENLLSKFDIDELLICGMMTQNCVTHTAMSKQAENYKVSIVEDCCTTTDEMIHNLALNAVSVRIPLINSSEAL